MKDFDYRKYLAEGKLLNEAELTDDLVQRVAQAIADEFTAEDRELDLKYVITPNSIESSPRGGGFDLDVNAGPNTPGDDWEDSRGFGIANYLGDYAGGSFVIRPEGDGHLVTNAASRNAKVAYITPEGEIEIISAEDSKADLGMTDDVETDYMERRREMSDYMDEAYTPGLGWTKDFSYDSMFAIALKLHVDSPMGLLKKVSSDLEDVNYHRENSYLTDAIDAIEAGDRAEAKIAINRFRKEIKKNINENTIKEQKESKEDKKPIKKTKMKKETVDSKLAEIEKQSEIVALEAKIDAIDEMIEAKKKRIDMVSEDENLSELVDKKKMKLMQREVKDLEKRKVKMEKLYEKMCGKSYTKEEMVDEEKSEELNENKNTMKKSELKEMIKSAMMAEAELTINDTTDAYDPVAEIEGMDEGDDMYEAEDVEVEDNEKVDVDIEKDVDVKVDDEEAESDVEVKSELPGEDAETAEVLGLLTKAQEAAQALEDEKLTDQIGNTITYYTRAHVARTNESLNESVEESAFPMWNKIK